MEIERCNLLVCLNRLEKLKFGESLKTNDLYFSIFLKSPGLENFIEKKETRISKPIISLWERNDEFLVYEIKSEDRQLSIISTKKYWEISGGKTTTDNPYGSSFLRIPITNFVFDSEARLYVGRSEVIYCDRIKHKKTQKPLNRQVLL